jgi:preprotein translocase subunit SecA
VLEGADTRQNILDYTRELIETGVEAHCEGRHSENWDIDGLLTYLRTYFPVAEGETIPDDVLHKGRPAVVELLTDAAERSYAAKEAQVGDDQQFRLVERWVMLETIDQKWQDYLTQMEHFREGIGLQAYGQRDPLVEYKNAAFEMFKDLTASIQADIVSRMYHLQFVREDQPPQPRTPVGARGPNGHGPGPNGNANGGLGEPVGAGTPGAKIGRNDPCWCGSGRKYKRCHGR